MKKCIINSLNKLLSRFDLRIIWVPRTGSGVYIPPQNASTLNIAIQSGRTGGGSGGSDSSKEKSVWLEIGSDGGFSRSDIK